MNQLSCLVPHRRARKMAWKPRAPFRRILLVVFLVSFTHAAHADSSQEKFGPPGMILIPAGVFTMGRSGGPKEEAPSHRLNLPSFWIDRKLVTQKQYADFMNKIKLPQAHGGPSDEHYFDYDDPDARIRFDQGRWQADSGFGQNPASEVSLPGAEAYCRHLGKRLPSEAEWEKAARGGDGRLYPWGKELPSKRTVHFSDYHGHTAPVGSLPGGASPYGVLDMGALLSEWTRSAHESYPYQMSDGREDLTIETHASCAAGSSLAREVPAPPLTERLCPREDSAEAMHMWVFVAGKMNREFKFGRRIKNSQCSGRVRKKFQLA
jgi:formylglycine-generating enzyme required for sulfatase activity